MIFKRPSSIHTTYRRATTIHSRKLAREGFLSKLFRRKTYSRHPKAFLRRDYVRKTFVNPYFHKSNMPQRTKAKKTKISFSLAALVGIVAVFLYHPFFDVHAINVKGNQKISVEDIQNIVKPILENRPLFIFKQKNFFVLNTDLVSERLKKHYAFEKISISKSPFSTLTIEVSERAPAVVVKSGVNFYYADKDGKFIGPADAPEASSTNFLSRLPRIWLTQEKQFALNDQIISPATQQFIISLFKMIPDRTGIALQGAIPQDEEGRLIHMVTAEGWQIYVDRQNDWEKQVTVLKNILNIKFKNNNRTGLQYIDVRYENRVYIK
ncbi:MAG: FtsQ-type POTRA domain-containing protein [Candidatus Magasanikbacteria bacterium]|nr:FtsQ-type POTRA domain-containing protein [Candidatus Magasanikbacteria bacterium]